MVISMKITTLIEDTCYDPKCSIEHGLALYIETPKHTILSDTGASGTFIDNAIKLGIDLTKVDTVVLSHGHYDHTGGMLEFSGNNAHADVYLQRTACGDFFHNNRFIGIDDRILSLRTLHLLDGDHKIDEELSIFSNITGRKLYARGNQTLIKRVKDTFTPDDFSHEQCLVVQSEGKKVLFSGCAHNGIINILDRFRALYHTDPDVVISGFHMVQKLGYTQEDINMMKETANELAKLHTCFYTGHCTGEKAYEVMAPILGDRLRPIKTGMSFEI